MRIISFPLLLLGFAVMAVGGEAPRGAPLPKLREIGNTECYAGDLVLARLRAETINDDPEFGLSVRGVKDGTPADEAGIQDGDSIILVDGRRLTDSDEFMRLPAGPHKLVVWSVRSGLTPITLNGAAADFGMLVYDAQSNESEGLKRFTREPGKWEADLLAAVVFRRDYPDLAETALARAQKKGYKGHLLRTLAATLMADRGKYREALTLGADVLATCPEGARDPLGWSLIQSALATGQTSLAKEFAKLAPAVAGGLDFSARDTVMDGGPADWLLSTTVHELRPSLTLLGGEGGGEEKVGYLRKGGNFCDVIPPYYYDVTTFGPEVPDVELSCTISLGTAPQAKGPRPWADKSATGCIAMVRIRDASGGDSGGGIIGFTRHIDEDVAEIQVGNFGPGGGARHRIRLGRSGLDHTSTLRMVVLGETCAVFWDKRCVWRGKCPIPREGRKLRADVGFNGVTIIFSNLSWLALDGEAPSTPPDAERRAALLLDMGREAEADAEMEKLAKRDGAGARAAMLWYWNRDNLVRSSALAEQQAKADPKTDTVLFDAMLRLATRRDMAQAMRTITDHGADLAKFGHFVSLAIFARSAAQQGPLVPVIAAHAGQSPELRLFQAIYYTDTGDFAAAQRCVRSLLDENQLNGFWYAMLYEYDLVLAPMFGIEPIDPAVADREMNHPSVPAFRRVNVAWLRGQVDDVHAWARAVRLNPNEFLYLRGLRNLSIGKHDLARKDFELASEIEYRSQWGGAARSLLAWYAKQTPASLAKLPRAGDKPAAVKGGANDF